MGSATRRPIDRGYIDSSVDAIDEAALEAPVRSALADPAARVTSWRGEPIAYDFLNPASGGIYRFAGTADSRGRPEPWSLVLKVTRSAADLDHGSPEGDAFYREVNELIRWDRELLAYESGFLGGLQGGFVPATCHGGARNEDGIGWLWLEDLGGPGDSWPLQRWRSVGHALGSFNGGFLADGRVPGYDWLSRGWLRVWVTRVTPFLFASSIDQGPLWDRPLAREALPPAVRTRLAALWDDRERVLQAVEALPRTCGHLDSHRRNLFLRGEQVVAVDWGLLGLAAPGQEIASTLVGTVASGEAASADAAELASILYDGYVEGLRDAGWRGDEHAVRLAYTADAALRVFSILSVDVLAEPDGDADEVAAALDRATGLAPVLLELGEEARARSSA